MSNNIKVLREATGKTQDEVASDLGVKLSRYRSWEQGKRSPTGAMGIKLAQYFGVSTDTVFGSIFAEPLPLNSDESHLIDVYRQLDPPGQHAVMTLVEGLAGRDE